MSTSGTSDLPSGENLAAPTSASLAFWSAVSMRMLIFVLSLSASVLLTWATWLLVVNDCGTAGGGVAGVGGAWRTRSGVVQPTMAKGRQSAMKSELRQSI